jgi:translocation and assembly module TamA
LEYSVGVGVRWRSPIGLIRIDVAAGISADNNPIGLHVVIGPDL